MKLVSPLSWAKLSMFKQQKHAALKAKGAPTEIRCRTKRFELQTNNYKQVHNLDE